MFKRNMLGSIAVIPDSNSGLSLRAEQGLVTRITNIADGFAFVDGKRVEPFHSGQSGEAHQS